MRRRLSVPAVWFAWLVALTGAATGADSERIGGTERVTLSLDDAELKSVLKSFALEYHLSIVAGSDCSGRVTINLFDVPVEDALRAILDVNGYELRKDGKFYFVERRQDAIAVTTDDEYETAVVWLDYITAEEAMRLIEPLRSDQGKFVASTASEQGIPSDATDAGGNSPAAGEVLVLRDQPAVIEAARRVLVELDRRPRQVLVEATILEVKLDDETKLGIDFNTLSGIDFRELGATSNLNTIGLGPAGADLIDAGFESVATSGFAGDLATEGLHVGILTSDVALFVDALEKVSDTSVLAHPRVLAVDRQRAEIIIGAKLGYLTATTTETATVQDVEFLDIGTQLRFRPFISKDGYVRLEIHPENSTGVVDPASGLPSETTTEVTTNVIVQDGNTIAIGGLIGEQVETVVRQVPGLGSLPWIGALFRQTIDRVSRREVIVLLTPYIVDGGARDAIGLEAGGAMAASRDRTLDAHMPFSRVRLASPLIRRAERALEEGRPSDALDYVESALELTPADVRASKLRLRILAALGVEDEETRVLRALEGLR